MKPIWRDNSMPLGSKVKQMHIDATFIYESWTLTAELYIEKNEGLLDEMLPEVTEVIK